MKATVILDPNKKALTPKQHEFLLFLQNFIEEHGFPPTMKEICAEMNLSSTNAANQYLQALDRKGYVRRITKGASRGIQILDFTPRPRNNSSSSAPKQIVQNGVTMPLPSMVKNVVIAGDGSAAQPLSVFLSPRGQVKIDMEFFRQDASAQLFCATVNDDGMSSDALRQGDTVLARQQFSAENGQLVVALLHDMTIVRRLNTTSGELVAGVRGFPPVAYAADSQTVKIIGVVVGMMRVVA